MSTTRRAKPLALLMIAPVALSSIGLVALADPGTPARAEQPSAVRNDVRSDDTDAADDAVVRAIDRIAHPLRTTEPVDPTAPLDDLRPFGRMVRGADVVGVGEATHNSHEFFTMKHRLFRYLVEEKGFATFALEIGWSSGLRINDYVLHGKGDIRHVMRQEFQGLAPWQTREFLDLFEWMRAYNNADPEQSVQFIGNDLNHPTLGKELTDEVISYVRQHHPELVPAFAELYRDFRAAPTGDAYLGLPLAERRAIADQTDYALELLRAQQDGGNEFAWIVQQARSTTQTTKLLAYDLEDPAELPKAMKYRDRVMAFNTAWWTEHTGTKALLSAHNGHVSYVSDMPKRYPKTQGAFLRDRLGSRYMNVGFSFDRGGFNATDENGHWTKTWTVGQAPDGFNEATLDDVRYRDYIVDTRVAPPIVRDWMDVRRPTRSIGTEYPTPDVSVAMGHSYDVLIHLHRISRARPLVS